MCASMSTTIAISQEFSTNDVMSAEISACVSLQGHRSRDAHVSNKSRPEDICDRNDV